MTSNNHRSTKGASKQRRDHINTEIHRLRDYLPLAEAVKDRLFQLQVMSLTCIYIRKFRYLPHLSHDRGVHLGQPIPKCFQAMQSMRGFLIMITRHGKLLYVSDNVSDYLGHSVEEIMSQGDNIYDLVDSRDHNLLHNQLMDGPPTLAEKNSFPDERMFVLRVNCNRTSKRQLQYHKFVMIEGRYLHPMEYYRALLSITAPSLIVHPVFAAFCQPLITPENCEFLCAGGTKTFRAIHDLDMSFLYLDNVGCHYLDRSNPELEGTSWYSLIHPHDLDEVAFKHTMLSSEKESTALLLLRLSISNGDWLWVHVVLALRAGRVQSDDEDEDDDGLPVGTSERQYIQAAYQVISADQAATLRENSWLYSLRSVYSNTQTTMQNVEQLNKTGTQDTVTVNGNSISDSNTSTVVVNDPLPANVNLHPVRRVNNNPVNVTCDNNDHHGDNVNVSANNVNPVNANVANQVNNHVIVNCDSHVNVQPVKGVNSVNSMNVPCNLSTITTHLDSHGSLTPDLTTSSDGSPNGSSSTGENSWIPGWLQIGVDFIVFVMDLHLPYAN